MSLHTVSRESRKNDGPNCRRRRSVAPPDARTRRGAFSPSSFPLSFFFSRARAALSPRFFFFFFFDDDDNEPKFRAFWAQKKETQEKSALTRRGRRRRPLSLSKRRSRRRQLAKNECISPTPRYSAFRASSRKKHIKQEVSSFAEDVEKFIERAKRKDGSLLAEKQLRKKNTKGEEEEEEEHVFLRERGNAHFKKGEFVEAERSYTKSLASKETAAALSNRAMVRLKLGKAASAAKDCGRSVDLLLFEASKDGEDRSKREALLVKTWQRKGTAEMEMKMYREAAVSFENALRIEPESKTIREQRKAAVKKMETKDTSKVKHEEVELRVKDFVDKKKQKHEPTTEGKKEELETPSPAASAKVRAMDATEKKDEEEPVARRSEETSSIDVEKVRKAISKLDHDDYEIQAGPAFDKQWKLAANSWEKKCKVLRAVRAENVTKILAERLTGDLLGDIIVSVLTHWISEDDANDGPINWLAELTKTNRFSMASMLLSGAAKTNAAESWTRCVQRLAEDEAKNAVALDRLERLRASFRV
jgi:tetratricopeptide (TPR) repeat protein